MRANDENSIVLHEQKILGKVPLKVRCEVKPVKLIVRSVDGQEFVRTLPSRSERLTDHEWNIAFEAPSGQQWLGKFGHVQNSEEGARLAAEVSRLRQLIADLELRLPPLPGAKLSVADSRSFGQINSELNRDPSGGEDEFEAGRYLQVYYLKNPSIDQQALINEFDQKGSAARASGIRFCRTRNRGNWLRTIIVYGPFREQGAANEARRIVGGDSFLVNLDHCETEQRMPARADSGR